MKLFFIKFLALSILSLLIVSSALFIIDSKQSGFSTLSVNPKTSVLVNNGQKIELAFTAKENYMGTIDLPLSSAEKGNIMFKFKEKNATEWYYESKFSTEQFNILSPYPFGFPVIVDSKNKEYLVNIEVLDSAKIKLTQNEIRTKYVFPKENITSNKSELLAYILTKYYYILLGTPIILYSIFFVLVLLKPKQIFNILKYIAKKLVQFSNIIPIVLFAIFSVALLSHNTLVAEKAGELLWIFFAAAILYQAFLWGYSYYSKKSGQEIKKQIITIFIWLAIFALLLGALNKSYILGGDDSRLFYLYPQDYFINYASKFGPDTAVSSLVSLLPPVTIAPFIIFLSILKKILIGINLQMFLFVLNVVGGIISFYFLLDYIIPNKKLSGFTAKGLASLLYVFSIFNFYTLFNSQLIAIYLISLFPLSMYLYIRGIKERKIYLLALCALIWSVFSFVLIALPWFAAAFLGFIPIIIYLFWKEKKVFLKYNIFFILFLLLLNIYWIFAASYSSIASTSVSQNQVVSSVDYRRENALGITATSEINSVFFPLVNLYHYTIQSNFNWPYFPIYISWYLNLLPLNSLLLIFILVSGVKMKKDSVRGVYIAGIFSLLTSIYFFTVNIGNNGTKFFLFLNDYIPGFVMFRNMYDKFGFAIAISFAFLIGICLYNFLSKEKRNSVRLVIVAATFCLILLNAKPFLTNEFYSLPIWTTKNTYNTSTGLNQDYINLTHYIKANDNASRYLWLPLNNGNISQIQDERDVNHFYSGVSPLLFLSGKNDYSGVTSFEKDSKEIAKYIYERKYMKLGELYKQFNVRYIIVNNTITQDIKQSYICGEKICDIQDAAYKKAFLGKKIKDFGSRYSLYEINSKYANDKIYLEDKTADVKYKKLSSDEYTINLSHVNNSTKIIFLDPYFDNWRLFSRDNKPLKNTEHSKIFNYANAWEINKDEIKSSLNKSEYRENKDGTIDVSLTLRFQKNFLYPIAIITSILTYIGILGYALIILFKHLFKTKT